MIKRSIQPGNITIINIYVLNLGTTKYIMQLLTDPKGEIDSNTITRHFNTPFPSMDISPRQKINKEIVALNDALDQRELTNIYIKHPIQKQQNAHFLSTHRTFSEVDHMLGHKKTSVNLRRRKSYQACFLTTKIWNK